MAWAIFEGFLARQAFLADDVPVRNGRIGSAQARMPDRRPVRSASREAGKPDRMWIESPSNRRLAVVQFVGYAGGIVFDRPGETREGEGL